MWQKRSESAIETELVNVMQHLLIPTERLDTLQNAAEVDEKLQQLKNIIKTFNTNQVDFAQYG